MNILKLFRIVAFIEGLSTIFLFCVAMPYRHFTGYKPIVSYTGQIHGVLFIGYLLLLYFVYQSYKLSLKQIFFSLIASIPPFGTFIAEKLIFSKLEKK